MTDLDDLRLLIADEGEGDEQLFTDGKLQQFLTLEGGSVKLAAAQALDTIASSEVLVSKVIRTQDLSTDGSKVAAQLRAHATSLRDQVQQTNDADDEGYFEIVDFDPEPGYAELDRW